MRQSLSFSVVVILLGACDAAEPDEACDVITERAYINGPGVNGININGSPANGIILNGPGNQGINFNGYGQGTSLGGIDIAGAKLDGTALILLDADDEPIGGAELLVGATLSATDNAGAPLEVRVDAIDRDTERDDIVFYTLTLQGENVCGEGVLGFFVDGRWDDNGDRHDDAISFSCTTGVIAKCVAWGYAPYTVGADTHQTCTRLARADYCGDGTPHTVDGTEIDVFDRLGVMRPDFSMDVVFEAGWGPDGAVCVNEPRWVDTLPDGEVLLPECWNDLPKCATEDEALAHGSTIANRSHNEVRNVCG